MRAARSQLGRLATTELERHRVFGCAEAQMAFHVAVQHGAGVDHLGVEQRARRQQPMEVAAMTVGPIHHRCHG